jgi:hypothetical protein
VIIDRDGRLFKKINIVDFFAILIVILVIGGMCFRVGSKYFKSNIMHMSQKSDTKIEYFKLKVENIIPQVAEQVKLRQRLCDDDKLDAWIVKIKKTPALSEIQDPENGDIYQKEDSVNKDLIITIKAKVLKDKDIPYTKIGNQSADIGNDFELKTKNIDIKGKIIGIRDRW